MSVIDLGVYGFWKRLADTTLDTARLAEDLGFGALWVGGSPPGDLEAVETLIAATERIPVVTGIVNMWRFDPGTVAAAFHRVERRLPGRLIVGLGIGHPEATKEYASPYRTMVEYLDRVTSAGVPNDRLLLAALGPRALRLAAERTVGAHPYTTTTRHTVMAREIMGPDALLAPTPKVVLEVDPVRARMVARESIDRYLRLLNYRNSLLREGWSESDLADGGSDVLTDALVFHGTPATIVSSLRGHLDAGASHVCIQVIGDDPLAGYRHLAGHLFG
ncbi:MAG: TIGR03620 family F420-dependent LLM class oxidoreductase [Actinobacteria bacterium]|nr:TIGR03620 family F420-dependent LLM class oxidoreductase [Actinomycetota bacterium]